MRIGRRGVAFAWMTAVAIGCAPTPALDFVTDEAGIEPADASGVTSDATVLLEDGAIVTVAPDGAVVFDASAPDSSAPDAGSAADAAVTPDAADPADVVVVHDAAVPDALLPDGALTCVPNPTLKTDCCPNGMECAGLACQHCGDCTGCALPGVCCATVNGGGKYKGMICSGSPVGCP